MTITSLELIRINIDRRKAGLKVLSREDVAKAIAEKPVENGAPDYDYLLAFDAPVESGGDET